MKNTAKKRSSVQLIPLLKQESLYIGIDIGKERHIAGFVSLTLLKRHQRFEACPALAFENSRDRSHEGVEPIHALAPSEHCFAPLEKRGHSHKALAQHLQALDIPVYVMHVQQRAKGMMKTDKRDALGLANTLYNQLALGV